MKDRVAENEYKRELYHSRKELGICVTCGNDFAIYGSCLCPECSYKSLIKSKKYRENMSKEQRERINKRILEERHRRKENGFCSCGKQRDNEKYRLCKDCRTYYRNYKRKKAQPKMWMELGLCRWCGGEVVEGFKFCAEHLEKVREQTEKNFRTNGVNIANNDWFSRANHEFWEEKRTINKIERACQ